MSAAVEGALERIDSIGFSLDEFPWTASMEAAKRTDRHRKCVEKWLPSGFV